MPRLDNPHPKELVKLEGWLGDSIRLGAFAITKNVGFVLPKSLFDRKTSKLWQLPPIKFHF